MKETMENVHKMKHRIAYELGYKCAEMHEHHKLDRDDMHDLDYLCDLLEKLSDAHEDIHSFMEGEKKFHHYRDAEKDKHYTR